MKLSALYIVRNEDKLIQKSLDSIAPFVDEVVVIDSNSVDRTTHCCRQYKNVSIYKHEWVHDYSKMRNFGIGKCTGDWILSIDADEMMDKRSIGMVRSAINSSGPHVMGIALHIIDHENEWNCEEDSASLTTYFPSPQIRVFRRAKDIQYEGRAGETVNKSIARIGGSTDVLPAKIHHFLWRGKGWEHGKMKIKYYNSLLGTNKFPESEPQQHQRGIEVPEQEQALTELAIVMLGFNGIEHTRKAIESVQRNTPMPHRFIFVDNGSTDGTLAYVMGIPSVKTISLRANIGVACGKNEGIKEALLDNRIKYVCVLDNDTIVTPNWMDEMMEVAREVPTWGVVGPMTSFADGPQFLLDCTGDPEDVAKTVAIREPKFTRVERVHGFCMLIKSDVLRNIGSFDISFGPYGNEDHDFCIRSRQYGGEIIVSNKAYVEHAGRASFKTSGRGMDWHGILRTSNGRFKNKWKIEPALSAPAVPSATKSLLPQSPAMTSKNPRVSIIILTHNRLDMTKECLESLAKYTTNYQLIVVDNNSSDGTVDYVRNRFPQASFIKNDKNLGVSKGRNQGIRASACEFLVLMDNDVIVKDGWLDELFGPIKNGNDISGIEAWRLDKNHAACHKCVSQSESFDYLGGACCLFKRKVFQQVGLLDEGFSPAYYEDPDICVRAKAAGMGLAWVPTHKINHREHSTLVFGQKDFNYNEALSKSYGRFAAKMRGELKVEHEKLPAAPNRLKILYLGMQWDYGHRERGESFEHQNFYPALRKWDKTLEFNQFDFVDIGKNNGIPKMSDMLYDSVQRLAPDVVFSVFFDQNHDPNREVMRKISQTTPAKTIGWFCDSHWRYDNFDRPWSDYLDFNVTTSQSAYDRYTKDGLGPKTIKSQWAASPSYFRIEGVAQDIDVSFVGQPHGDRRQVINQLRAAGVNVQVFGTGWGRRLSFDEMIAMFNRSKINLNLLNASDAKFKQIKGRNFEVPACGGFILTELAENLSDYYASGKEMGVYTSLRDVPELVRHYLTYENERKTIANAGYNRTMFEHTYAHRFNHIFARAGLL